MTQAMSSEKADKSGYDDKYRDRQLGGADSLDAFVAGFEQGQQAFCRGGETKGYVRQLATNRLLDAAGKLGRPFAEITVVDAGSGLGGLSIYLAAQGFRVYGVDISEEGCRGAQRVADSVGVGANCTFVARSLEATELPEQSVDLIIGHASLHHFIKYAGVPAEFRRLLKPGGQAFFADAFGENRAFRLFHNKERMRRLGDVSLTRDMILDYFDGFDVEIVPTDWFVMLDKLYLKLTGGRLKPLLRLFSRLHFALDRAIPGTSRTALRLSGSIMTAIRKRD